MLEALNGHRGMFASANDVVSFGLRQSLGTSWVCLLSALLGLVPVSWPMLTHHTRLHQSDYCVVSTAAMTTQGGINIAT